MGTPIITRTGAGVNISPSSSACGAVVFATCAESLCPLPFYVTNRDPCGVTKGSFHFTKVRTVEPGVHP